jgi:hypothetical protein
MHPDAFAAVVETCIKQALAPLVARIATIERGDVALAATKAIAQNDIAIAALGERLDTLETREGMPGPPGPAGPAGKDGAGLQYCGVYVGGKSYGIGDAVTSDGSLWICRADTAAKPGADGAWQLAVKRGRDARDRDREATR